MEEQIIKCPCGQDNHLVLSDEGLRYKVEPHGNGEPCNGLCFNCQKPLAELIVKETQVVDEVTDDDTVELEKMSKEELYELAVGYGIDVPDTLGKKKLIKRIEEFQAANAAETRMDTDVNTD